MSTCSAIVSPPYFIYISYKYHTNVFVCIIITYIKSKIKLTKEKGAVALTNVSVAALFYKKTQIPVFEKAGICGKI